MTNATAKSAYEHAHKELCQRIALLMSAADKHQKDAQADEKNWGFVGDINRVNELLAESLLSFGAKQHLTAHNRAPSEAMAAVRKR